MKKVLVCVGTRPNLIKITQLEKAFKGHSGLKYILLHTGQHYDTQMNDVFFNELKIKKPDYRFQLTQGTQTQVIAQIMQQFEEVCLKVKPSLVVVPGDVNSSFACAFVADRLGIPVAHIESGLRSFDKTMPEEANRILIDKVSSLHFVTEQSGKENLIREGHSTSSLKMVGNSMIDSLIAFMPFIDRSTVMEELQVSKNSYSLFTFHRPVNVDEKENLKKLISLLNQVSQQLTVVFPIHPRTRKNITKFKLNKEFSKIKNIKIAEPLGYLDFLKLVKNARFVITDSGGVQEETTYLKVPCLTIRPNTERPITTTLGSNTLLAFSNESVMKHVESILSGGYKKGKIPPLWDGKTSERIVKEIAYFLK